jgi:hypothetical protein
MRRLVLTLACSLLTAAVIAAPQGFGSGLLGRHLSVDLTRKMPSLISFSGSTVRLKITVAAQGTVPRQYADILRTRLTAEVFKDSRIVEEARTPDTVIEATITDLSATTRTQQRSVLNDRFQSVPQSNRVLEGLIVLSYRTLDGRTMKGLDSGNLRFRVVQEFTPKGEPYRELFGRKQNEPFSAMPTREMVNQHLIDGMVWSIARRIVPSNQTTTVPMPMGKLESASRLGVASRWGAMIEALEKMPAFTSPAEEAFRQYGLGVANEALAYQETDDRQQQDFLAKAALGYKNAIRLNAGEEAFRTAQDRLATYSPPEPSAVARPSTSADRSTPRSAPDASAFTNQDVIKLAAEKFSDDFILDAIGTARKVDFDVSTTAVIALKRAGVSEKVIKAMRDRIRDDQPQTRFQ